MSLQAGDKLGPYEIIALIGAGGMGEVYRARDPRLGRDVAIKVSAAQFSERFEREARAVAALNHPNICTLYDVGPNYLVMELVEGEAPKGPLALEEALRIAKQIAEALCEAHEKGITHRDLKPGNIKVKPDGTVKVLDFGLAKFDAVVSSVPQSENSPTLSMAATQMGVILGTAAYMPPEQARGKPVDKRADIWAFGVVLHEMLTGERLFQGEDVTETLASVVKDAPKLEAVPFEVRRLLRKCLEKDPKKRLRDIGDVWELLDESRPEGRLQAESPPHKHSLISWVVAGLAVVAAVGLAFVHLREVPAAEHVLRYTVAPPEGSEVHSFAVSPDGKLVAISATIGGKRQLWLRSLDTLQWTAMATTEGGKYPFWSPDSRNIGFFGEGKMRKIAAAGGPSQPVCDVQDGRGGSWNREDMILFSANGTADGVIQRVPAAGGVPANVTKTAVRYLFPTFLPDGQHFVYETAGMSAEQNGIYVASLDGKDNRRILTDVSSVVFAPASGERNGHLLFLRENNLMAQPFDARSLQTSGDVFPVAEKIALANTNNYAPVSVSENDVLLYWAGGSGGAGGDFQMIWYDRGGKVPELVGAPANVLMPAISPDEKSIAFSKAGAGTTRDIWLRDLVRGSERRFTIDPSSNNVPFWSPKTGERIVFRSNRGNKSGLYIRASSGSGQDEVLVSTPNNTIADQWSRDARFIVYSEQDPKTRWDLWVLPMDDSGKPSGKPTPFLHSGFSEIDGQLSPDSKWMAYTSDVSGAREVYVQPFPAADNEIRISTAGGEQPRWRGDGRELYYIAADGKMTAVTVTETAGPKPSLKAGTPVALFDAHSASAPSTTNSYFNYDVTADGKRFLVSALGAGAASASAQAVPPLTVQVNWRPAGRK